MLFFVRFDIKQPADVSNRQLIEIWDREGDVAVGALDAGAIVHAWKVAGERAVLAVCDFPDAESLDRALAGLPIITEMGSGVTTTTVAIYDYRTFASDLKAAAQG